MVFFHGGAFMEGSNRGPFGMYDGQKLQRLGVVVATVNYRLDALGFLTTRALEGNWGIKDQRFALQWVQRNIAAFGGDPGQVTIFGESAGAMSVGIHMVSPLSKGLFHAALMESNPAGYHYKTPGKASAIGRTFTESLGCKCVACRRRALSPHTSARMLTCAAAGTTTWPACAARTRRRCTRRCASRCPPPSTSSSTCPTCSTPSSRGRRRRAPPVRRPLVLSHLFLSTHPLAPRRRRLPHADRGRV